MIHPLRKLPRLSRTVRGTAAASMAVLGFMATVADGQHASWNTPSRAGVPPFDTGLTPSQALHVATNGNNATGDGSPDNPYATLVHAATLATPGTAIVLAPGTYAGGSYLTDLAGTPHAPIWIRGAHPANRPVLAGGGEGLHLTRARYLVVEHLEVAGSTHNGINCDDGGDYANSNAAHHIVFRNLHIHDVGGTGNQDGLKLSGVYDFWVLNSAFSRCGGNDSGSGIDHVGCHRGVIADCDFHDLSANAIQCKGGTTEIDITRCRIVDAGQRGVNLGGSTGFEFFRPPLSTTSTNVEARAIRVVANHFRGSLAPVAFVGCRDVLVAHNTFIDPAAWHLRILQETVSAPPYAFAPCGDSAFVNNLVYFERARLRATDVNVGPNTAAASFTFSHNLWYAHDVPGDSAPDLPAPETAGIRGVHPLLANPAASNLAITLASPAATQALAVAAASHDFTGAPYLPTPSIGAHEITGDLDHDGLPDAWELLHFGSTNAASASATDTDGDGAVDAAEFVAGTDPTNPASRLAIADIQWNTAVTGVVLHWPSVSGRTYRIDGGDLPSAAALEMVASNLPATPISNVITLHHAQTPAPHFYRLGVRL